MRLRPRVSRGALALGATALLALLCCGGGVTAVFLTDVGGISGVGAVNTMQGCGEQGLLPLTDKLPSVRGLSTSQLTNAAVIIRVGRQMGVPPRGWVVGVATAMQESRLSNLGHLGAANDHDSIGLFQQRPSMGWGTPRQLRDPAYTARKFFAKLVRVPGWQHLPLTRAAQKVQRSAYPDAYAKHEPLATDVVNALAGGAARAAGSATGALACAQMGEIAASGWTAPVPAPVVSAFRTAQRPGHHGIDLGARRYTTIRAAAGGVVSHLECDNEARRSYWCDRDGSPGTPGCGWYVEVTHAEQVITRYCHLVRRPVVQVGQTVAAGAVLGQVGTSGNSSGPHLHFEVHLHGDRSRDGAVDPVDFLRQRGVELK
ncbi:MAG TPA: M23 family metallopeptidase [Pilimelia sp.]|nr:M23 family metallopeptidase [Pilimelia sp.]